MIAKSWIAQEVVVDPLIPVEIPYLITLKSPWSEFDPNCPDVPVSISEWVTTTVQSVYRGDNHLGLNGSSRLQEVVEFDFDGKIISNFHESDPTVFPHVGISERRKTYTNHITPSPVLLGKCSTTKIAPDGSTATQTGPATFKISYAGGNPLAPPISPRIQLSATGTLQSDGTLVLAFTNTWFPSHGIQVLRDSASILDGVVNDTSCLSEGQVNGIGGAARLTIGLIASRSGRTTANPGQSHSESSPSPLCSGVWKDLP